MKRHLLFIPLSGGILALLCFFFPWVKIDISSLGSVFTKSGGSTDNLSDNLTKMFGPAFTKAGDFVKFSGFSFGIERRLSTLAFIAALAIIGICLYMLVKKTPWEARFLVFVSSGVGLLCLLFTLSLLTQEFTGGILVELFRQTGILETQRMDLRMDLQALISPQFGGFGAAIGFIVAIIGAWSLPKSDPAMVNNE